MGALGEGSMLPRFHLLVVGLLALAVPLAFAQMPEGIPTPPAVPTAPETPVAPNSIGLAIHIFKICVLDEQLFDMQFTARR